jgi:hypothetical protein
MKKFALVLMLVLTVYSRVDEYGDKYTVYEGVERGSEVHNDILAQNTLGDFVIHYTDGLTEIHKVALGPEGFRPPRVFERSEVFLDQNSSE